MLHSFLWVYLGTRGTPHTLSLHERQRISSFISPSSLMELGRESSTTAPTLNCSSDGAERSHVALSERQFLTFYAQLELAGSSLDAGSTKTCNLTCDPPSVDNSRGLLNCRLVASRTHNLTIQYDSPWHFEAASTMTLSFEGSPLVHVGCTVSNANAGYYKSQFVNIPTHITDILHRFSTRGKYRFHYACLSVKTEVSAVKGCLSSTGLN